jgi:uncharacterized membrane protein (DUF2068 family)
VEVRGTSAEQSSQHDGSTDQSRLLPLLAVERGLRAVVLLGVGLILLTHAHTDWADLARRFAEQVGLDPSRNETGRLISRLAGFAPRQAYRDGTIAVGYGVLEAVEGYGLLRRRRWGEYLTIVSTALLLIPEVQELFKHLAEGGRPGTQRGDRHLPDRQGAAATNTHAQDFGCGWATSCMTVADHQDSTV